MAILFISEFVRQGFEPRQGIVPAGEEPAIATQIVDFTGGVAQSSTFNAKTNFIAMIADTAGYFVFGTAPTAVTLVSPRLAADVEIYRGLLSNAGLGSGLQVSIIL